MGVPEGFERAPRAPELWLPKEPGDSIQGIYDVREVLAYDPKEKEQVLGNRKVIEKPDGQLFVMPDHWDLEQQLNGVQLGCEVYAEYTGDHPTATGQGDRPLKQYVVAFNGTNGK